MNNFIHGVPLSTILADNVNIIFEPFEITANDLLQWILNDNCQMIMSVNLQHHGAAQESSGPSWSQTFSDHSRMCPRLVLLEL
jgi:hypothetical protein